jgi:hypothetical protein
MDIKRSGSRPSGKGPADWFTGTVRIDPLFEAPAPGRVSGASVSFEVTYHVFVNKRNTKTERRRDETSGKEKP